MTNPLKPAAGTFWWGQVIKDVMLSVPPSFDVAMDVSFADTFGLSVPPQVSVDGAARVPNSFTLSVPPQMDFTQPGMSAITLSVPPAITVDALGRMPAEFGLSVPPSMDFSGVERYSRTVSLSVPPSLDFAAVGKSATTFDALGAGNAATGVSTARSWSHTATAGTAVVVGLSCWTGGATITSVTYGGQAMTLIGLHRWNNASGNGYVALYGLAGVAGGTQTVTVNANTSAWMAANSVSLHASSVGAPQTAHGNGIPMSQAATCDTGEMLVQIFGTDDDINSPSGGTMRWSGANQARLRISTATESTTFTATRGGFGGNWSGLAVAVKP